MARSKNAGPLLTSITKGQFDALPADLRASLTVTRTDQKVNLDDTGTVLSSTVMESDIIASQTNERKETTVTVSGLPVTLSSKGWTGDFGGGATTITKVYAHNSNVTPAGSLTITDHSVTTLWNGVSVEEKQALTAAAWPTLHGVERDRRTGVSIPFTRQVIAENTALSTANAEIRPLDEHRSEITIYSLPTSTLIGNGTVGNRGTYFAKPRQMDIQLPDVLLGIDVVFNEAKGNGTHNETGEGASGGTSASLSLSLNGRGQASASLMPSIVPLVREGFWPATPVTEYTWFMALNPTHAQIATRLTLLAGVPVQAWPAFCPQGVTLLLLGQSASLGANASAQQHVSGSSSTFTYTKGTGTGRSNEFGITNRVERLSPTIHGALNFSGTSLKTATITATATASIAGSGSLWPAIGAASTPNTQTVLAYVYPTSIEATPGVSSIPTGGLYYRDLIVEEIPDLGIVQCRAIVVNFASLQP